MYHGVACVSVGCARFPFIPCLPEDGNGAISEPKKVQELSKTGASRVRRQGTLTGPAQLQSLPSSVCSVGTLDLREI